MIRKMFLSVLGLGLSGAASAEWTLNMRKGVTALSLETYQLHMLVFWWCVGIGIVVFGTMIVSLFLHRKSRGAVAAKFSHSTTAEVTWTIIPVVILLLMAIPTAETMIKLEDTRDPDMSVVITGYQWRWHYQYQNEDIAYYSSLARPSMAARFKGSGVDPFSVENYLLEVDHPLVVPKGAKVRLLVTSNDVIHSWWVPDFAIKRDAIPGMINEAWFKAEKTGTFRGQCAELCGKDHGYMPIVVRVVEPDAYKKWADGERKAEKLAAASQ